MFANSRSTTGNDNNFIPELILQKRDHVQPIFFTLDSTDSEVVLW